jgi:hypothetical protein
MVMINRELDTFLGVYWKTMPTKQENLRHSRTIWDYRGKKKMARALRILPITNRILVKVVFWRGQYE